jgi:tRNA pseudouridine38-40 synthase
MTRNLKLTLAYNGAPFHGWQVQPGKATIQGSLAEAVQRITGETVMPQGSGRTDAGVHALAQVASFSVAAAIPPENLVKALNSVLPDAIRVLKVEEVAAEFHARHSAKAKTYRYRIFPGSILPPFLAGFVCHHPYPLNAAAMHEAAALVVGEHDFTAFAASDPDRAQRIAAQDDAQTSPSNVRTIFSSAFEFLGDEANYTVRGSGFLHHMVRNLIGTFLLVGKGTLKADDVRRILASRDRSQAGPTAPAEGLYLVDVEY